MNFFNIFFRKIKPKLLLHICCAGCGAYVSKLLKDEYDVVLYYNNGNIFPQSEWQKRLDEVKRISKKFSLPLIVEPYDHESWLKEIKGHEADLERGERCLLCYAQRLKKACLRAKQEKCFSLATTLSVSPHKLVTAINNIGREESKKEGIVFLERDFKKQDGFKKASELSTKFNFYRQDYCGCEFSKRKK